jgi:hypothetical protein
MQMLLSNKASSHVLGSISSEVRRSRVEQVVVVAQAKAH